MTEAETMRVVDFWKEQATPEYDDTFLMAPPAEDDEESADIPEGEEDPRWQAASG